MLLVLRALYEPLGRSMCLSSINRKMCASRHCPSTLVVLASSLSHSSSQSHIIALLESRKKLICFTWRRRSLSRVTSWLLSRNKYLRLVWLLNTLESSRVSSLLFRWSVCSLLKPANTFGWMKLMRLEERSSTSKLCTSSKAPACSSIILLSFKYLVVDAQREDEREKQCSTKCPSFTLFNNKENKKNKKGFGLTMTWGLVSRQSYLVPNLK